MNIWRRPARARPSCSPPSAPETEQRLALGRLLLRRPAPREDPLVVDAAQLALDLHQQPLGRRQQLVGGGVRPHVDLLAGHVAVRREAHAVRRQRDLDAHDLAELLGQVPAALLDRLAHRVILREILEVGDQSQALRQVFVSSRERDAHRWRKRTGIEPAKGVSPRPSPDLKSEARTSEANASESQSTRRSASAKKTERPRASEVSWHAG